MESVHFRRTRLLMVKGYPRLQVKYMYYIQTVIMQQVPLSLIIHDSSDSTLIFVVILISFVSSLCVFSDVAMIVTIVAANMRIG